MNKVRMTSLFSGIGAFEKSLKNIGVDYELVNSCEFDKYASISYCAVHGEDASKNLGDITKVNEKELEDFNLLTWGSPCQDFSVAGDGKGSVWECKECKHIYNPLTVHHSRREACPECGSKNLNKSRSSLLVEGLRILKEKKPEYSVYENVKNIMGKKHKPTFDMLKAELDEYGYINHVKVLNLKEHGLPQNRERVFIVSIRKDVAQDFEFPSPFDNGLRLKDMLEDEVDERYYLPQEKVEKLIQQYQDELRVKEATKKGYAVAKDGDSIYLCYPSSTTRRGRVQSQAAHTIQTMETQVVVTGVLSEKRGFVEKDYSYAIDANYYKGLGCNQERTCVIEMDDEVRGCSLRTRSYMDQPQQLEMRLDGASNCITSVPKDSMICVPVITPDRAEKAQNGRRFKEDGEPMFTLTAQDRHGIMMVGNVNPSGRGQGGIVISEEGVCPAICVAKSTPQNVLVSNEIIIHNIKQKVRVRVEEVDVEGLKSVLRDNKKRRNLTNKEIAEALDVPVTKVEHWFRQDLGFAIPDPEIWYELKNMLMIETDEFDFSITQFEEKDNVYEKADRVYDSEGIAPTITVAMASTEKILERKENELIQVGEIDAPGYNDFSRRVYDANGIARTIMGSGGNLNDKAGQYLINYRIRRLTSKECWRLQGFTDEDYEKAKNAGISESQLYKQAGNSIGVPCLEGIFRNLFLK